MNARLASFETVKRFAILPGELTEAAGELTPKMSVKRKVVVEKYRALIDSLYTGPGPRRPRRLAPKGAPLTQLFAGGERTGIWSASVPEVEEHRYAPRVTRLWPVGSGWEAVTRWSGAAG